MHPSRGMAQRLPITWAYRLGSEGLPDDELLQRFVAGDHGAFTALMARHAPRLKIVCRLLLPTDADAEDAVQETFLRLIQNAKRLAAREGVKGWLFHVAQNVARDRCRAVARRRRHEQSSESVKAAIRHDIGADHATPEWLDILQQELARMPAAYREPFVLRVVEDLGYAVIGTQLKLPVRTAPASGQGEGQTAKGAGETGSSPGRRNRGRLVGCARYPSSRSSLPTLDRRCR